MVDSPVQLLKEVPLAVDLGLVQLLLREVPLVVELNLKKVSNNLV